MESQSHHTNTSFSKLRLPQLARDYSWISDGNPPAYSSNNSQKRMSADKTYPSSACVLPCSTVNRCWYVFTGAQRKLVVVSCFCFHFFFLSTRRIRKTCACVFFCRPRQFAFCKLNENFTIFFTCCNLYSFSKNKRSCSRLAVYLQPTFKVRTGVGVYYSGVPLLPCGALLIV